MERELQRQRQREGKRRRVRERERVMSKQEHDKKITNTNIYKTQTQIKTRERKKGDYRGKHRWIDGQIDEKTTLTDTNHNKVKTSKQTETTMHLHRAPLLSSSSFVFLSPSFSLLPSRLFLPRSSPFVHVFSF